MVSRCKHLIAFMVIFFVAMLPVYAVGVQELREAVSRGDVTQAFDLMLQVSPEELGSFIGANPDFVALRDGNTDDESALHKAAKEGHLAVAEILLKNGADLAAKDRKNSNPLHWAVNKGDQKLVELFLQKRPDLIDVGGDDGMTPLHIAVGREFEGLVNLLLEKNAKVDVTCGMEKTTPLGIARDSGNKRLEQILLLADAIDKKDYQTVYNLVVKTDFMVLKNFGKLKQLALMDHPYWGIALNYLAIAKKDDAVDLLIDAGTNMKTTNMGRLLYNMLKDGNISTARLLIKGGANLQYKESGAKNRLALHVAMHPLRTGVALGGISKKSDDFVGADVVRWLLKKGAPIDEQDADGETALHHAARNGFVDALRLLLENRADSAKENAFGQTALQVALAQQPQNEEAIRLLSKHADSLVEGKKQETLKSLALGTGIYDFLNGISIFVNDESPSDNRDIDKTVDAVCNNFAIAIAQQASPIIVAAPVLFDFLWRRREANKPGIIKQELIKCINGDGDIDAANKAYASSSGTLIAHEQAYLFSQIPFDDNSWLAYPSPNKSFYLLLPTKLIKKVGRYLQRNQVKTIASLKKKVKKVQQRLPSHIAFEIQEITGFFKHNKCVWNIYMIGHGLPEKFIAGLPVEQFQQLLSFFATKIYTNFLYYATCYGGGINLVTPFYGVVEKQVALSDLPFTVATQATTEVTASVFRIGTGLFSDVLPYRLFPQDVQVPLALRKATSYLSFPDFFSYLHDLHVNKTRVKQANPWRQVLSYIAPRQEDVLSSDTPLIRFSGTDFFNAIELEQRVAILTEARKRAAEYSGEPIVLNGVKAWLFYPHTIQPTIKIENTCPRMVSMNPEAIAHVFTSIDAHEFTLDDVAKAFLYTEKVPERVPVKFFVIQELICQNYTDSGIDQHFNTLKNVIVCRAPEAQVLIAGEAGTYYKGKVPSTDGGLLLFKKIGEANFTEEITVLLEHYAGSRLRMYQGGQFVAPWQIEPAVQAYKISKLLGVNMHITPEAQEKFEAAKKTDELEEAESRIARMKKMQEVISGRQSTGAQHMHRASVELFEQQLRGD